MGVLTSTGVGLRGISVCLPAHETRNEQKLAETTGIVSRRVAGPKASALDLCVKAARQVLAETRVSPADVGAILFVSFTQPDRMPAAAIQAQAQLGLARDVIAFDVSLACSGWGYGLYLASLLVRETGKLALVLDGDVQTAYADDDAVAPLLADGGTATLIGPGEDEWKFSFAADGEKGAALRLGRDQSIHMDGFGVFRFVATDVVRLLQEFRASVPAFDWFVPHQPNVYMVRQLAKSAGLSLEQTAISCDRIGNLASASIPATIALKGKRGRILFAGFGGGLSVALGSIGVPEQASLAVCTQED